MRTQALTVGGLLAFSSICHSAEWTVTLKNPLPQARSSQTIEINASQLDGLAQTPLNTLHVQDASGTEVLCQAVDSDGDELHQPDQLIFQSDFAPDEQKNFKITVGKKQAYKLEDYKAFGRFVRERFDDFAWENDRIAHRTYGKALETWKGEPLTSSSIDIWTKRTPKMVINDWYLQDDYHVDHGQGADYYSAGKTRGCGGDGIWAGDKLWVSGNFTASRVLANGPIRVLFELDYDAFTVEGKSVRQTKRVSLDAGHQLSHYQSRFTLSDGSSASVSCGVGLKKVKSESVTFDAGKGILAKWEAVEKNAGQQGLAIIAPPASLEKKAEDDANQLAILKTDAKGTADYWAGFAWDKAGRITSAEAWQKYLEEFAREVASPVKVIKIAP
jgi:Domain of unknown function (DUF4861)